jgi:hypothetical protein
MNIQVANVLSDVSGVTGQAIIQAILADERDPQKLAAFRDPRVKASEKEIARSLEGSAFKARNRARRDTGGAVNVAETVGLIEAAGAMFRLEEEKVRVWYPDDERREELAAQIGLLRERFANPKRRYGWPIEILIEHLAQVGVTVVLESQPKEG